MARQIIIGPFKETDILETTLGNGSRKLSLSLSRINGSDRPNIFTYLIYEKLGKNGFEGGDGRQFNIQIVSSE